MAELTIYTIAVGFFLGAALKDFFHSVTESLVSPFVGLFSGVTESVEGLTITIGSLKLKVGEVLSSFSTLLVALFVVAFTLPVIKAYAPLIGARR